MYVAVETNNDRLIYSFSLATPDEVLGIIIALKFKPSTGMDGIPANILKSCSRELCLPLLHVINLSLKQGKFPQRIKISKVIPIHKQGNKVEQSNYRPSSLIPIIYNEIEKKYC